MYYALINHKPNLIVTRLTGLKKIGPDHLLMSPDQVFSVVQIELEILNRFLA